MDACATADTLLPAGRASVALQGCGTGEASVALRLGRATGTQPKRKSGGGLALSPCHCLAVIRQPAPIYRCAWFHRIKRVVKAAGSRNVHTASRAAAAAVSGASDRPAANCSAACLLIGSACGPPACYSLRWRWPAPPRSLATAASAAHGGATTEIARPLIPCVPKGACGVVGPALELPAQPVTGRPPGPPAAPFPAGGRVRRLLKALLRQVHLGRQLLH